MKALSKDYLIQQAWLYLRHGRTAEAITVLEALHVITPADTWVHRALSYAYLKNQDYQQCLDLLKRSLGTPKSRIDQLIKIRAHWGLGQRNEAQRLLKHIGGQLRETL